MLLSNFYFSYSPKRESPKWPKDVDFSGSHKLSKDLFIEYIFVPMITPDKISHLRWNFGYLVALEKVEKGFEAVILLSCQCWLFVNLIWAADIFALLDLVQIHIGGL